MTNEMLEELLQVRSHVDYRAYLMLLEIMPQLNGKTQRMVRELCEEREAINEECTQAFLGVCTESAGGAAH